MKSRKKKLTNKALRKIKDDNELKSQTHTHTTTWERISIKFKDWNVIGIAD